jgi:radical SAM superfamily enzyme YgiQ (UPF0313 family)
MKVSLITASTYDGLESATPGRSIDQDSPLGVLSLAASLRIRGVDVVVHDLTGFLRDNGGHGGDACMRAADRICATRADVYGFGTICSSYPLTLRLAQEVRSRMHDSPIILGGPQATVTDRLVVREFSCIDVVVRGEGEHILPDLLDALASGGGRGGGDRLRDIPGITWRDGDRIVRNPDAPLIVDLDTLPDAAFDLDVLMLRRTGVSIELGRGCPFACEFCSTNDFFRRKFRLKSPARVIEQMRHVRDRYGHTHFSLVHDMFTVDRRKVVAFCDAMCESRDGMTWSCSARTDCVDDELLQLMASAGCVSVFFGVESGSPDQQRRMGKHLDLDEARAVIASAARLRLHNTVSLIVGFPEETKEDFRQTVSFFMDAARYDYSEPQMHLLAPLAGTPLAIRCRDRLELHEEIYSDASVSAAGLTPGSPEYAMIAAHPDLFINFYLIPAQQPLSYLNEARVFLSRGVRRCRWLLAALHQEAGGILDVIDDWLSWRIRPDDLVRYYHDRVFVQDLLRFVSERYYGRGYPATDVMVRYLDTLLADIVRTDILRTDILRTDIARSPSEGLDSREAGTAFDYRMVDYGMDAVPMLPPDTRLLTVTGSVHAVMEALGARRSPLPADVQRVTHLLVRHGSPIWDELTELSDLLAAVLRLCDGTRHVTDVIDAFAAAGAAAVAGDRFGIDVEGVSLEAVCDFTLGRLGEIGLVRFHDAIAPSRHLAHAS